MADHYVRLNYTVNDPTAPAGAHFAPDHDPIAVHRGQTIAFQLGTGPPDGKIRLTFAHPEFFSTSDPNFSKTGRFNDGDGEVRVGALTISTTYHCELLVDGVVTAASAEKAGGGVVPDGL
jgi:hypothetical protein